MMKTLTELANQYNSDKGDQVGCCHRYAAFYEEMLGPFRHRPVSFLEIGLQREFCQHQPDCPSLRMWLEFFPHAEINGFDISDFSDVQLPRCRIFQGDQGDPSALTRMAEEAGPFDIIIDDGSHASSHQQITLGTLFPYLKPGGLFIIEDAHWQPERDAERREGIRTMVDIFKRHALYGEPISSPFLSDDQCRDIEENMARCTFSHPVARQPSGGKQRGWLRHALRRLIKGKRRSTDGRLFKLIILEKSLPGSATPCATVSARTLTSAIQA